MAHVKSIEAGASGAGGGEHVDLGMLSAPRPQRSEVPVVPFLRQPNRHAHRED